MQEEWRDIVIEKNGITYDYTGLYQVSNLGRVRSMNYKNTGTIQLLKLNVVKSGYVTVGLYKDEKYSKFFVHRLVATAFILNPQSLPEINHKDFNKTNNSINNLEWISRKGNVKHSYEADEERSRQRRNKQSKIMKDKYTGNKNPMHGKTYDENPRARSIICIETLQVFTTIKEAKEWLGKGNISSSLKDESKTAGGYHWMYYEDWLKLQENKKRG